MKLLKPASALSIALLLGLAACSDNAGQKSATAPGGRETIQAEPKAEPAAPVTEPKASEAKPQQPAKAERLAAPATGSEVSQVAVDACMAAVKAQTNEADLAVLSTEYSEANSLVMVGVGANRAPWKCLVSNDGKVGEVMFTGTDGDAVQQPAKADQPAAPAADSEVSQLAVDACMAAVKAQTNEADLAVLSTEYSEANSLVMVGVGPNRAPWKCLVSNNGQLQEVMSAGSEGKL